MELIVEGLMLEVLALALKLAITQLVQWLQLRTVEGAIVPAI